MNGQDVDRFDWELALMWKGLWIDEILKEHMTDLIEKCPGCGKIDKITRCWKIERFNWRREDGNRFDWELS